MSALNDDRMSLKSGVNAPPPPLSSLPLSLRHGVSVISMYLGEREKEMTKRDWWWLRDGGRTKCDTQSKSSAAVAAVAAVAAGSIVAALWLWIFITSTMAEYI